MPHLTNENKSQIYPFLGGLKRFISKYGHLNQSKCNLVLDSEVKVQFWGCQDIDEVEAEGTKTMSGKELKGVPPPIPITGLVTSSFGQRRECHLLLVS